MKLHSAWATFALAISFFALAAVGSAQSTNLRIIGGLSNFDCWNETGSECEGFEIEIENCHSSDVLHTYNYSRFGGPSIIELGSGINTSCVVRYYSSTATVLNGGVTHFGVSLRMFVPSSAIHYRWLPKVTVEQPNPQPVPVELPSHGSIINPITNEIEDSLENPESRGQIIWVLPFRNTVPRHVELEELTNNAPLVVESEPMGGGTDHLRPEKLDPGDTWVNDDLPEEGETHSGVYWFKVYEDHAYYDDQGRLRHEPGAQIATVMDASNTAPEITTVPVGIYFGDPTVVGSQFNQSMIQLDGQAAAGGATVFLSSSVPAAIPPGTVTVLEGQTFAIYDIATVPVYAATTAEISATLNGTTISDTFVINPPSLNQVWLSYINVRGGTSFSGAVYLLGPAPENGVRVSLRGPRNGLIEAPNTAYVLPGQSAAGFKVKSQRVSKITTVRLDAVYDGVVKSTTVRLLP